MKYQPLALVVMLNLVLTHLAYAESVGPFDLIAGNWSNDAKFQSNTLQKNKVRDESLTVSRMYGQISKTGKMVFLSDNGCHITGLITPGYPYYNFEAVIKTCLNHNLNGIYTGTIYKQGLTLSINGRSDRIFLGYYDSYKVSSTMVKY